MQTFTRFGPYEIIEEIGHGGMGIVYRAHDTRLNRDVALKVIADSYLSSSATPITATHERFLREARSSSALNHPNICTIYDVGEKDGRPYLVMELLEGRTLKQIIHALPLPVDQVLDYSIQLASALVEAHRHGILHRDIKPANLFVVRRGQGNGVLKVLDFGLAKRSLLAGDASATNSMGNMTGLDGMGTLTTTGSTVGTVAYMAPEQARGEELDGRADVFSAGVVMYEMATGSSPFFGQSVADIIAGLLAREPEPIRKRVPQFPKELDRVIQKALAKDKEQRYSSAAELLADLERVRLDLLALTGGAISAGTLGLVKRRRDRWRWMTTSLVVVLLGMGAFFGWRWWKTTTKPPPLGQADSIIVSEFTNRTGDPSFDFALKQALTARLQQSPFLNVVSESHLRENLPYLGKPADAAITPPIAREIAEREGDKAVINGTIASIGNQYLITLEAVNASTGDVLTRAEKQADGKDKVLDALRDASDELRKNLGESLASIKKLDVPRNEATTPSLEAFRFYALGQSQQAQANYKESITFYKRAIELDPNFAMAYASLGVAYVALGDETQGNAAITRAFELSGKGVSERERLYIRARYYMNVTGDLPQAIEILRLYRETYPNDAAVPSQLSVVYLTLGQFERAYEEVKQTLKMNPASGPARVNAILSLTALNRFQDAKQVFDQAEALNLADDASVRGMWIYTAYLMGDRASVQQQLDWAHGQPDGFILNSQMALIHENEGRFTAASQDWQMAINRMTDQKLVNATATLIVQQTLDRAMVGSCEDAMPRLDRALQLDHERTMQGSAALAFALCGQPARAMEIRRTLAKDYPQDTIINHAFLPDIDAVIDLGRNRPQDALTDLAPAADYDILGIGAYLRGLAHLALKDGAAAAADFSFPATHRSVFVLCQVQGMNVAYPLSMLGLARAEVQENDLAKARQQYQAFFDYWKAADPNLPPLVEAHKEAARLGL